MNRVREVTKTKAELEKMRKHMLRSEFMPLTEEMEHTFPTMKRVLRKGCGYSFNPYCTAYLKLMKWSRKRLDILADKVTKCIMIECKSYQQEQEALQQLEYLRKKYP